jgi:hypothetical protein
LQVLLEVMATAMVVSLVEGMVTARRLLPSQQRLLMATATVARHAAAMAMATQRLRLLLPQLHLMATATVARHAAVMATNSVLAFATCKIVILVSNGGDGCCLRWIQKQDNITRHCYTVSSVLRARTSTRRLGT